MGLYAVRHHGFLPVRRVGDDPPAIVLAGVLPSIRPRHYSVRAAAALFPDRDLALGIDLVDPVVSRIGEVDSAVLVDCVIGGELVPLSEQLPVFPPYQYGVYAT